MISTGPTWATLNNGPSMSGRSRIHRRITPGRRGEFIKVLMQINGLPRAAMAIFRHIGCYRMALLTTVTGSSICHGCCMRSTGIGAAKKGQLRSQRRVHDSQPMQIASTRIELRSFPRPSLPAGRTGGDDPRTAASRASSEDLPCCIRFTKPPAPSVLCSAQAARLRPDSGRRCHARLEVEETTVGTPAAGVGQEGRRCHRVRRAVSIQYDAARKSVALSPSDVNPLPAS